MTRQELSFEDPRVRRAGALLGGALALLLTATLIASMGRDPKPDPLMALGLIVSGAMAPVGVACLLLASALGLGSLGRRCFRDSTEAWAIQLGLGVALLITLAHALGALGLLITPVSIGLVGLGLILLGRQLVAIECEMQAPRLGLWWLGIPALALLLVAALAPPGWLWDSEYGAYDVLSYHLRLPQEWLASGRIEPSGHNVYSYLPGGIEAVYALIGSITLAPTEDAGANSGLLAGSGWRAIAAQAFHASLALVSAWTLSAFVRRSLAGTNGERSGMGAAVSGLVFLATPWVIVVGSLAYNEMGATALGAGAMLVAIEDKIRPLWRGALCGLLVGGACAAKPTAIFLVAPVVGVLLLGMAPARSWPQMLAGGVLAGVLMLSPWMARNAMAGGNPVFPQMTEQFGSAHWTKEQAQRYAGAHQFQGSIADRVQTLVWSSPESTEDSPSVQRWRGAINPQFASVFPAALLAGAIALGFRSTRRLAALLLIGLGLQAIAWLSVTHLQSRFLIPSLLPATALLGLSLGSVRTRRAHGPLLVAWVIVIIAQSTTAIVLYRSQHQHGPNGGLLGGVQLMRGDPYDPQFDTEVRERHPLALLNNELPEGSVVLLVGGATPLYISHRAIYSTTWDRSALAQAIDASPGDPTAWNAALRDLGATHALVDLGELRRFDRSAWLDPRLTLESFSLWFESLPEPIQTWPAVGTTAQALYRLDP